MVLIIGASLVSCTKPPQAAGDVSVLFLGLTNNPGRSIYPQFSVVSEGRGLHALFAITNISKNHVVQFGISDIERQTNGNWVVHETEFHKSALGMTWMPGNGACYAIPLPRELKTSAIQWRLRMWVLREPNPFLLARFQRLGLERLGSKFLRTNGLHTVTSTMSSAKVSR